MSNSILEVEALKKHYGKQENLTKAIDGISLQVMEGEFIGIMGSSGSGKTTLLNCIASAAKPTEGRILLCGKDIGQLKGNKLAEYRGAKIGYLFQNFELLDNLSGRENLILPLAIHGKMKRAEANYLKQLVEYLDIGSVLSKFPAQMSGGEKQRIAAARALALNPEIVLADEPTGALDSRNARLMMEKLSGINRGQKSTILMVTHDPNAASYCSRILFIEDGKLFHELRRRSPEESRDGFYKRIITVTAQLGGGSANVL